MLLSAHLDRAGRCNDAARLAVDAAKHFAAEGRAAALQKRCDRFKACQKTELPLLWGSCGNLLTYQLLLLLRIRDLKPTWTTWNVQSSMKLKHQDMTRNRKMPCWRPSGWIATMEMPGRAWWISFQCLGTFQRSQVWSTIWREKTKERERQKMNMMFFCFRPKVCLIQVYTDAIHGFSIRSQGVETRIQGKMPWCRWVKKKMSRFGDLRLQSERVRGCSGYGFCECGCAWERRMQSLNVERGLRSLNGFQSQGMQFERCAISFNSGDVENWRCFQAASKWDWFRFVLKGFSVFPFHIQPFQLQIHSISWQFLLKYQRCRKPCVNVLILCRYQKFHHACPRLSTWGKLNQAKVMSCHWCPLFGTWVTCCGMQWKALQIPEWILGVTEKLSNNKSCVKLSQFIQEIQEIPGTHTSKSRRKFISEMLPRCFWGSYNFQDFSKGERLNLSFNAHWISDSQRHANLV